MKQDSSGGYCPRCDTVWASPGVCNCQLTRDQIKSVSEQATTKLDKASVFEKEVWNEAIEAAAKISDNWNFYCAEEIRGLKK